MLIVMNFWRCFAPSSARASPPVSYLGYNSLPAIGTSVLHRLPISLCAGLVAMPAVEVFAKLVVPDTRTGQSLCTS